ncbi:MAG: hypothetical protein RIS85_1349 [Pseudomonadota bacterium]|jgi:ketosteroid isomerase-like protein
MTEKPTARALVEQWYDSLQKMDIDRFAATLSDDFINNVVGRTPISGRSTSKKQLFDEIFPRVMENLDPATVNLARRWRIMAVDDSIVVGMMEGGAMTLDGTPYEQQYCQIFRIEDGLIAEIWEFFDTVQCEARLFRKPMDVGAQPVAPLRF